MYVQGLRTGCSVKIMSLAIDSYDNHYSLYEEYEM